MIIEELQKLKQEEAKLRGDGNNQEQATLTTGLQSVNLESDQFQMDLKRVNQCPACHQKIPDDRQIVAGNIPAPFNASDEMSESLDHTSQQEPTFEQKEGKRK